MPPRTRSAGPAPAVKPLDFSRPRKKLPKKVLLGLAKPQYEFWDSDDEDEEEVIRPVYKDAATQTEDAPLTFSTVVTTVVYPDSVPALVESNTNVTSIVNPDSTPTPIGPSNVNNTNMDPDLTDSTVQTPPKRRIEAVEDPETTPPKRHAPSQADSLRRVLFPPRKASADTTSAVSQPRGRSNVVTTATQQDNTNTESEAPTTVAPSTLFGKVWNGVMSLVSPQKDSQVATPIPQPVPLLIPQSAPAGHRRRSLSRDRIRPSRQPARYRSPKKETRKQFIARLESTYGGRKQLALLLELEAKGKSHFPPRGDDEDEEEAPTTSNKRQRMSTSDEEATADQPPSPTPIREQEEQYNQEPEPGSNKRKRGTTFGLAYDDEYYSDGDEPNGAAEDAGRVVNSSLDISDEPQPTTPIRSQPNASATPLKSALKSSKSSNKSVSWFGPIDRTTKKTPQSFGDLGPAGHYQGGVFGPPGNQKSSSPGLFSNPTTSPDNSFASPASSGFSPGTMQNTMNNATGKLPAWLVNKGWVVDPNPIAFQPPTCDPEDPEFNCWETEEGDLIRVKKIDEVPAGETPVPTAPKMSHAELPGGAPPSTPVIDDQDIPGSDSTASAINGGQDSGNLSDADERANKLRQSAQKHAPKQPSRLSHVQQARSRSSSPPATELRPVDDVPGLTSDTSAEPTPSPTFSPEGYYMAPIDPNYAAPGPFDNIVKGPDGMTDYEREHQYDEFFRNGFRSLPLYTYEDRGTCSGYVGDLLDKTVTKEDKQRDHEFHQKQYNAASRYIEECKEQGVKSTLIGGDQPEDQVYEKLKQSCWAEYGHMFENAPWNKPQQQQ